MGRETVEMIQSHNFVDWKNGLGKLCSLGKKFTLPPAADVVREISKARDEDRVLYARKAITGWKLPLSPNA